MIKSIFRIRMNRKKVLPLLAPCVGLLFGTTLSGRCAPGSYAWMEGESGKANFPVQSAGWGRTDFLSGGKWLHCSIEPGKVSEQLPASGGVISYSFTLPAGGPHEVWGRIGFEFVRSPFEWRVDDGEWKRMSPEDLTTDLMELDTWCEVAWLKFGEAQLSQGAHRLEIRITRDTGKDGKPKKVLFACDALCVSEKGFVPNGKFKPDESGRTPADIQAEKQVFQLPEANAGQRATVALSGTWEIARDDEMLPAPVAEPVRTLPRHPIYRAIPVPGDKGVLREDLLFAHRVWYRTRVRVPASMGNRAFTIEFPLNNLNTTVYVNGRYCGFEKNPFCRFSIDVTDAVQAGKDNEILVCIRDAWYGRTANPDDPMKLRRTFNSPIKNFKAGFQDFDYPVWNCPQSGLLATPVFSAAGKVYASDVFVKPSVATKTLASETTLCNRTASEKEVQVRQVAVDGKSGKECASGAPFRVRLAAGETKMVPSSFQWSNPRLWWPDDPQLYFLRTEILVDGKLADTSSVRFGFREWSISSKDFLLNGVRWRMWSDLSPHGATKEAWLDSYRKNNIRAFRYVTAGQGPRNPLWYGLEPEKALDFFDESGVVIRRNSTIDGEMIGYNFYENDPAILKKQGGSKIKMALMQNWLDQCVAQVKGERNHPSIQIWTIENEFAYINLLNLVGRSPEMDVYEGLIKKTHDAVMKVDPTRSVMIDGGGALKDNSLGVHGDHYVATLDTRYPDLAYEAFPEGGGRGRWRWSGDKPRYLGEDFFANGIKAASFATWGGEVAFQGNAFAKKAVGLCYKMLQQGYRWGEQYAAWAFWLGADTGPDQWDSNAPRAVFCREWDRTFASGQTITRTFGIFNDSRFSDPITFRRAVLVNGKPVYTKQSEHRIAAGCAEKFREEIRMPNVTERTEGKMLLVLMAGGKEVYRSEEPISILPPLKLSVTIPDERFLAVYDPKESVIPFLTAGKIPFTRVSSLSALPAQAKTLLVGVNALTEEQSVSSDLAAYASSGHSVLVLDQDFPLRHQALPAEMESVSTNNTAWAASGSVAFIEDTSHSIFAGLRDSDFFTWTGHTGSLYRNAYVKPESGAKSLLQAGPSLAHTVLTEVPSGRGVVYLCQLSVGSYLRKSAVARQLLANLISASMRYRNVFVNVAAVSADPQLTKALDSIGLRYSKAASPLEALTDKNIGIAVISATPENLSLLASSMPAVQAFWDRGGLILFHGLTPNGLAAYNKIVGFEHILRPFTRERVQLPPVRDALTAGISNVDVVMSSGKRIFGFRADEYTVDDAFTYILDDDDIAPFCTSDFGSYKQIINGFVGIDGWPLIIDYPMPKDGERSRITIKLPRRERITSIVFDQSVNYNPTTKLAVSFDGGEPTLFDITPDGEACDLNFRSPVEASSITLEQRDWQIVPGKARKHGIDNIRICVERSPEYRRSVSKMLNIGGMMHYRKGKGGVVLCNLKFQENEAVPLNAIKKRNILSAVLRNLKAPFASGKTVIVGAKLRYKPVDIHTKATTYRDEKGWFGNKNRTFSGIQSGLGRYAGIDFDLYEMPTSPTPQALMIAGNRGPGGLPAQINGIPVQMKADALFFLHTAQLVSRPDRNKKEDDTFFRYIVRYENGRTEDIPVRVGHHIDNSVQKNPVQIAGARLAWVGKYDNSDDKAVAYAMQWNNPHPDWKIVSIDIQPVKTKFGTPVLLALTAADAP